MRRGRCRLNARPYGFCMCVWLKWLCVFKMYMIVVIIVVIRGNDDP